MNMHLVIAALLALTAPLAGAVELPRAAGTPAATVVGASVTDDAVADGDDGASTADGVAVAEVDLEVPPLAEIVAAEAAEAAEPAEPAPAEPAPAEIAGSVRTEAVEVEEPAVAAPEAGTPTPAALDALAPDVVLDGADETATPVDPGAGTTVAADGLTAAGLVETEPVDTDGFQTVGITWPAGADAEQLDARVRTSTDGVWGEWIALEASESPDPGTADAAREVRDGTDSLWIGHAEAVQLAFTGTEQGGPEGMSLALVGSDLDDDAAGGAATATAAVQTDATSDVAFVPAAAQSVAAQGAGPRVIPRAEWKAPAQTCRPGVAKSLVGAVVHHTAGSTSYRTVAEAMQQLRNDANYQMKSRGWCDLGYNFVVDKWGNIYEGRGGGLTKAVIGVHAGGFNTGTVGVSMLGTYGAAPSAATQRAVASIIGWRLGAYGVDPQGSMTYWTGAGQNSKYKNRNVRLPRIFSHRDVAYTACPGAGGMAALPAIRTMAAQTGSAERFEEARSVVTALYHDLLGRAPDSAGLAMWTEKLAGGTDQSELVYLLTRSDEYILNRVDQAYRTVLGRAPELAGAADWLNRIRVGSATVDDVQRRFFDSDEFSRRSGTTTEAYVSAAYGAALGRPISVGERAARAEQAESRGRAWFVDDVWFSTEAAARRAGAYYRVFLQREPDSVGVAQWASVLLTRSEGAVRTGIAGSSEYRERAIARYP